MKRHSLNHIRHWVFDLDNTLYPAHIRLFDRIELKMRQFMVNYLEISDQQADELRRIYWRDYGTTLAGMMHKHAMPPDDFLDYVHDIDFSGIPKSDNLSRLIAALPGKKYVFTNGTAPYARNVLQARGLHGVFDDIYGIEHAQYCPKPNAAAYDNIFAKAGIDGAKMAMFEDEMRNLEVPRRQGAQCFLIGQNPAPAEYVHKQWGVLENALEEITGEILTL